LFCEILTRPVTKHGLCSFSVAHPLDACPRSYPMARTLELGRCSSARGRFATADALSEVEFGNSNEKLIFQPLQLSISIFYLQRTYKLFQQVLTALMIGGRRQTNQYQKKADDPSMKWPYILCGMFGRNTIVGFLSRSTYRPNRWQIKQKKI